MQRNCTTDRCNEREREREREDVTFGADGRNVGPVVLEDDLDHGLGLQLVGRDDAHEVAEAVLVAQVAAGGAVADLWDVEQLQQILHLLIHQWIDHYHCFSN